MELVKRINAVMYIKHLNSGWECHKHILKMSAFCLIPIVISHVFSTLRSNTIPKCTGPSQDTVSKLLSPIPLPTLHIPWFLCYQNLLSESAKLRASYPDSQKAFFPGFFFIESTCPIEVFLTSLYFTLHIHP